MSPHIQTALKLRIIGVRSCAFDSVRKCSGVGAHFEKHHGPTLRAPLSFLGISRCYKTKTMLAHTGHGLIFEKFEHLAFHEKVTCCEKL